MAKSSKKSQSYSAKIAGLKKLGYTGLPSARKLTTTQKKSIAAKYAANRAFIEKADKFAKLKVTKGEEKAFKQSGYKIIGDKAIIPRGGFDTVRKRTNKSGTFIEKTRKKDGLVYQQYNERVGQIGDRLDWKKQLRDEAEKLNLKKGDVLGLRVWDNGMMGFTSALRYGIENVIKYAEGITVKGNTKREKFLNNLHVAKMRFPRGIGTQMPPNKKRKKRRKGRKR